MRRVVEAGIPLVQLGIRAFCEEERDARKAHKVIAHDGRSGARGVSKIRLPKKFSGECILYRGRRRIAPSVLPATARRFRRDSRGIRPSGCSSRWRRQRRIIGFDVMESRLSRLSRFRFHRRSADYR